MKTFIITVLIFHLVRGNQKDFKNIDSIIQEQPCARAGGSCTIVKDCPKGQLAEIEGLCPIQKKQGIDCCYGISLKETRCIKHGGVCMKSEEFCNPSLVYNEATDCADRKCCIMTL